MIPRQQWRATRLDSPPQPDDSVIVALFFLFFCLLNELTCCKSMLFLTSPGEVAVSSSSKDSEKDFDFSTCPQSFKIEIEVVLLFPTKNVLSLFFTSV